MSPEQIHELDKAESASEGDRVGRADDSRIVDRIRDILIGSQMREYEGRLQHLDQRLVREAAEARAAIEKRLDAVEQISKEQLDLLSNRISAEESERRGAVEKLYHVLAETTKAFDLKIKNLDQYAREIHDLHRQLLEDWKRMSVDFKEKQEQMQAGLKREAEQIRGAMLGRDTLAEVFSDLALRLKNDSRALGS
jgi:Lhr-like helicase